MAGFHQISSRPTTTALSRGRRRGIDCGARSGTTTSINITRPASASVEIDESGYLGAAEWLLPAESPDIVAIAHRVQHDAEARSREPDHVGPTSMTRTDAPWFLSAFAPELSLTALLLRPGSTW